jgi:tetratricopeptide (TPR) repeat protein
MKKNDTDLQDIYHADGQTPEEPAPARTMPELLEQEVRRHRLFILIVSLSSLALFGILIFALLAHYGFAPVEPVSEKEEIYYVPSHTLPADEQWALEYRQVAPQADSSEPPGRKTLSTKWLINTAYHIIMGEQALRQNSLEASQHHLEKALEAFPELTGIQRDLGRVYLKQQSFDQAARILQQAQEQESSVELLNNLGAAYLGLQEYGRAETLFRQALQIRPDLAGCYRNLALLYQKTGITNQAVAAFEQYFALNPEDLPLLETYTAYLTGAGRSREAIRFLDRLEGADPLAVQLLLAKSAARDNDTERAVLALREAASFLSPRQMIAEMHDAAFEPIARTEPFETLTYQLELASVSLSTNLTEFAPLP